MPIRFTARHHRPQVRYPGRTRLLITADCGGSNGARVRLQKTELQTCADQTGLSITEAHHLPGTSKWNRIKHRLFAFITQNWRGKPLLTHQVITQLIASMVPGLVTATHRMSTAERQEGTAS